MRSSLCYLFLSTDRFACRSVLRFLQMQKLRKRLGRFFPYSPIRCQHSISKPPSPPSPAWTKNRETGHQPRTLCQEVGRSLAKDWGRESWQVRSCKLFCTTSRGLLYWQKAQMIHSCQKATGRSVSAPWLECKETSANPDRENCQKNGNLFAKNEQGTIYKMEMEAIHYSMPNVCAGDF